MIDPSKILKESRVTEKATTLTANLNQYTFEVYPGANRRQVRDAVEQLFKVEVARVNILNTRTRKKANRHRRGGPSHIAGMKRAIVTLKEGEAIAMV